MLDDRHRLPGGAARLGRLDAIPRISDRPLRGGFRYRDALQADIEAGIVHHREHGPHAALFLADQPADAIVLIAIGHDAGRRGVDAHLVDWKSVVEGKRVSVRLDIVGWRIIKKKKTNK